MFFIKMKSFCRNIPQCIVPAPVVSNHGKLWGRARARGAGVERLKDHRCMPVRTRNARPTSMT